MSAGVASLLAATPWGARAAEEARFEIVHPFGLYPTKRPAAPKGDLLPLAGLPGTFAGVSSKGGSRDAPRGTVYTTDLHGNTRVLHAFANDAEGITPNGTLVQGADGRLYGTTAGGGRHGGGTIYAVAPDGTLSVVHDFAEATGNYSTAGLATGADGAFYGTTMYGGPHGAGGIFRVDADGRYALLHAFGDAPDTGADPAAELTLARDGSLWGTTRRTGRGAFNESEGNGTVFRYVPGGKFSIIHRFKWKNEGCLPSSSITEGEEGLFYGTTQQCGIGGNGTVFRMPPDGSYVETIHRFRGGEAEGALPSSRLTLATDGSFYGTTIGGGSSSGTGKGTIYKIDRDGSRYEVLHVFDCRAERVCHPNAGVVEVAPGLFFGADGGMYGEGPGATYLLDTR